MAGNNTNLGFVAIGGLALLGGASYVYGKYKDFKTRLMVAEQRNELNDKIIQSQNDLIDELEKKLRKIGS